MKTLAILTALSLSLALTVACGDKKADDAKDNGADKTPDKTPDKAPDTAKEPDDKKPEPAKVDYAAGQSTGKQTEDRPGKDYRNTLVDKEIGASLTCPPDKTWKCKLEKDGMWRVKDMSSNIFTLRVVPGATSAADALAKETAYLTATLPDVKEKEKTEDSAILDVGANPDWAKKVPRVAWVKVKDVGGTWFACHGIGSDTNFENASKDYVNICDSVAAAE